MHLVDYKVRVINSEAATAASVRVIIESRDDDGEVWGTVGVNENVIEASWDALVDSIEYKLCKDEGVSAASGESDGRYASVVEAYSCRRTSDSTARSPCKATTAAKTPCNDSWFAARFVVNSLTPN